MQVMFLLFMCVSFVIFFGCQNVVLRSKAMVNVNFVFSKVWLNA